jgi:hypothetical protein
LEEKREGFDDEEGRGLEELEIQEPRRRLCSRALAAADLASLSRSLCRRRLNLSLLVSFLALLSSKRASVPSICPARLA